MTTKEARELQPGDCLVHLTKSNKQVMHIVSTDNVDTWKVEMISLYTFDPKCRPAIVLTETTFNFMSMGTWRKCDCHDAFVRLWKIQKLHDTSVDSLVKGLFGV